MTTAAQNAVAALGYKAIVADGRLTPTGWTSAMSLLLQRHVDGVIKVAQPDSATPQSMANAKQANVPVVCAVCANGASKPIAAPSVANSDVDYAGQGKAVADWIIDQTNGMGKVYGVKLSLVTPVVLRHDGLKAELATCAGCKLLDDAELTQSPGLDSRARSLITAQLSSHSKGDLDYVVPPSDSQATGVVQALRASGRNEVKVTGFDCELQSLKWIREGGLENACADTPLQWLVWGATDQLARKLSGQPAQNVTLPFQLITKDNLPPAGQQNAPFDFATYYKKLWGK
jgi:ribose transport system substrate-binding protein